jgi:hypothetical protein
MTIQETFVSAEHALTKVISQIKGDQWAMVMPPEFATRSQSSITLREVVNYHAYDDVWVPDTLSGKTIEEVGTLYDGDLLGEEPMVNWQRIVDAAILAVESADMDKIVHLTYGDFPAHEYLRHIISFRGLRAVDIARVIGVDDQLPEDLAQSMYDLFAPDAEQWRAMGVFKAVVEVPADAPIQARLLGMTGRQPSES